MNQSDDGFNSERKPLPRVYPLEGLIAIAVISTLGHSELSPDQVDIYPLVDKLWATGLFKNYSGDELLTRVEGFLDRIEEEGLAALLNAAYASLTDDLIPEAFAIAVRVILGDSRRIPSQKQAFIQEFQKTLKLQDHEAQEIINNVIAATQT